MRLLKKEKEALAALLDDARLPARFWAKVVESRGCWIWTASRKRGDYPGFHVGTTAEGTRRTVSAHRWAYERLVGPIPSGMCIDHLCNRPPCVNPAHMELVTIAENHRRRSARQGECLRGHPFNDENTYRPPGEPTKRVCRTCQSMRDRLRKAGNSCVS